MRKINRKLLSNIIIIVFMSLFCSVFMLPYVRMILDSFKTRVEVMKGTTMFPKKFILDNYRTVFQKTPIVNWFFNSLWTSTLVTVVTLFTSSLAGFVFAKYEFKGKQLIFWFIMATMMVPAQTTMIPSFLIIQKLGLYDNLFAIVFPSLVGGFGIFLCKQFIEDIPDSMVEAASIDGAGNMRIFFMVILPLIKPTLSALAIFTFLGKWNDYLNPLLYLSDISRMTMPLALSFFTSQRTSDLGGVMAAATLVILPVTIVFLCFQKQFVRGISITGMK
ncbi:MAG TPA: carbohydrate ABC transporter permease [Christensenellaceae bacterium]|nr:carbohydrate ABC transporter permease [Christensenellaceae bacterium]